MTDFTHERNTDMAAKPFPNAQVIDKGIEDGIHWVTAAAPFEGAVNGYVQLPENHPWLDYELQFDGPDIDVHGGITFGPTDERWIGFDTLHAGDSWPVGPDIPDRAAKTLSRLASYVLDDYSRTWTAEAVADETRKLAGQAAEALRVGP